MSAIVYKINEVWRTCNKIRTLLAKNIIDIKEKFQSIAYSDFISSSKFLTVINSLSDELELTDDETVNLVQFFANDKDQINYKKFLEVLQPSLDCDNGNKQFVSGLEWEDPMHINVLSQFEHRQVNMILTKIAHSCRLKDIIFEPYFLDYEMMSKNDGTITITHFRRVLNFLGITLGSKEFRLLVKKFMKHNYTVNYVGFIEAIKNILKWFNENGHVECSMESECYPGNIIICDYQNLPRPEFNLVAEINGIDRPCHPCQSQKKGDASFEDLMLRIKKHILDNCIRTKEFFEKFDCLRRGFITTAQFLRGLDAIGVSGLHRLYIAQHDVIKILKNYEDPLDVDRINWKKFCDDIDEVFEIKNLHKQPYRLVECPPTEVKTLNRPGTADWECIPISTKQLAQETVFKLRKIIEGRQILIEPFFRDFDSNNYKHVTKCQMRRVFSMNSIVLSDKEILALMARYGNDMGFNYMKFLRDINEVYFCESKHEKLLEMLRKINEIPVPPCTHPERTIIEVLAKIKGEICRKRINLDMFLKNGQKFAKDELPVSDFRRNFSAAGIILEDCELDIVCDSCRIPSKPDCVNHKLFIDIMNEAFTQIGLEKQPLRRPIPLIPTREDSLNFLNFEERFVVSHALQKLSKYPDDVSNLSSFLTDYDGKSGYVTITNFQRGLKTCGLIELLTDRELNVLCKCFSVERGNCRFFDFKNLSFVTSEINKMQ
ncbi:hypothetical protein ACKWTF_013069 [Chironomus riparius]